jgi:hypothetical protein
MSGDDLEGLTGGLADVLTCETCGEHISATSPRARGTGARVVHLNCSLVERDVVAAVTRPTCLKCVAAAARTSAREARRALERIGVPHDPATRCHHCGGSTRRIYFAARS